MSTEKRIYSVVFVFLVILFLASSFQTANTRVALQTQLKPPREAFASSELKGRKKCGVVSMSTTEEDKTSEPLIYQPDGTSYIMCGACKTAYVVEHDQFANGGRRVRCSVCNKEWFQNDDKVQKTNNEYRLTEMSGEKVAEVKQILADRNFPKYPRVDKIGVFMGNLPYAYDEKDIYDLVAEYGVTQVSLVRDQEGQSKGFAFAEVSNQADADLLIEEMHHFYTDHNRKLTVRVADKPQNPRPDRSISSYAGRQGGRGGGGRGGRGGRGGKGGKNGKAWSRP